MAIGKNSAVSCCVPFLKSLLANRSQEDVDFEVVRLVLTLQFNQLLNSNILLFHVGILIDFVGLEEV